MKMPLKPRPATIGKPYKLADKENANSRDATPAKISKQPITMSAHAVNLKNGYRFIVSPSVSAAVNVPNHSTEVLSSRPGHCHALLVL